MTREPNIHQYFVYIMTSLWQTVLYTGMTNSLEKRVWQHKNGAVPGFTKRYNCNRLVYFEIFQDVTQTIAREKEIKRWSRVKKEALINDMNPKWKDLAEEWYAQSPRGISRRLRGSK